MSGTPYYALGEIEIRGAKQTLRVNVYSKTGKFEHLAACDTQEKADRIVLAVNAHDEMLAALRDVVREAASRNPDFEMTAAIDRAIAAIAKAEGR